MIDAENAVINNIILGLRNQFAAVYPGLKVYDEYVEYPESFPCVCVWCADNYTYTRSQDESSREHHANVMFTTEVYATGQTRKAITKKLANAVDEMFQDMGFTRQAMMALPNYDRSASRITMRHQGVVSAPIISDDGDGNETQTFLIYRE